MMIRAEEFRVKDKYLHTPDCTRFFCNRFIQILE